MILRKHYMQWSLHNFESIVLLLTRFLTCMSLAHGARLTSCVTYFISIIELIRVICRRLHNVILNCALDPVSLLLCYFFRILSNIIAVFIPK